MELQEVKTFDNKELGNGGYDALCVALFNLDLREMERMNQLKFANKIIDNFVMANTKEDILKYLLVRLSESISRGLLPDG